MGVEPEGKMEVGTGLRGGRWSNSGRKVTTPKLMYLCVAAVILLVLASGWSWPLPSTPRGFSQIPVQARIQLVGPVPHRFGSVPQFPQELGSEMMMPQPQQEQEQGLHDPAVPERASCDGRRVYTYTLPASMNTQLLERCGGELVNWIHFCKHHRNYGFGAELDTADAKFRRDWYGTDAYMLEVIYYERMKRYACLTTDPRRADLFYIPFFAGLDALPYLYRQRDQAGSKPPQGRELVAWLARNATETWGRYRGHDHFYVAGRTAWDFSDSAQEPTGWGTTLYANPELENVTSLVLERRPWRDTEQAIPYPVGFHPSSSASLQSWIEVVKSSPRPYLFSFSGALRPQMSVSIRGILSQQCTEAGSACTRLDCARMKCSHEPEPIYTSLLNATFCLQPRGDTATRRSVIDSIVAGCIPVFFHEDTAKTQYRMHLPIDYENFSVFISEAKVKDGSAKVQRILETYTSQQVQRMRARLIYILPHLLYRHPMSVDTDMVDSMHDAFDVALAGLAQRALAFKPRSP